VYEILGNNADRCFDVLPKGDKAYVYHNTSMHTLTPLIIELLNGE
jgi:hypothetical protein